MGVWWQIFASRQVGARYLQESRTAGTAVTHLGITAQRHVMSVRGIATGYGMRGDGDGSKVYGGGYCHRYQGVKEDGEASYAADTHRAIPSYVGAV